MKKLNDFKCVLQISGSAANGTDTPTIYDMQEFEVDIDIGKSLNKGDIVFIMGIDDSEVEATIMYKWIDFVHGRYILDCELDPD